MQDNSGGEDRHIQHWPIKCRRPFRIERRQNISNDTDHLVTRNRHTLKSASLDLEIEEYSLADGILSGKDRLCHRLADEDAANVRIIDIEADAILLREGAAPK